MMIPNITTEKRLAKFAPLLSNPYGYELRWIQVLDGELKIWCAPLALFNKSLPVLKCRKDCSKIEYEEQALALLDVVHTNVRMSFS